MSVSISFIPLEKFNNMELDDRVNMLIEKSKNKEILLVEGILTPREEMELIKKTMSNISRVFRGIEIESITSEELKGGYGNMLERIRARALNFMLGRKRGITIIGPAAIVKKIKKNPENISLLMK